MVNQDMEANIISYYGKGMCAEEIAARLLTDVTKVKDVISHYENTYKASDEKKDHYSYLFTLLREGANQLRESMAEQFERGAFEAYSSSYENYLNTIRLYLQVLNEYESDTGHGNGSTR